MKRGWPILSLLFLSLGVFAQSEVRVVDSLMKRADTQQGREQLLTLLELSSAMSKIDFDKGVSILDEVASLAQDYGFADLQAKAYYRNGYRYLYANDLEMSRDYLVKAQSLYEALHDTVFLMEVYYNLAMGEMRLGSLDSALVFYEKALVMADGCDDEPAKMDIWNNVASIQYGKGNLHEALRCFERNYVLAEQRDDSLQMTCNEANMATVLSEIGAWKKAKAMFNRAIPFLERHQVYAFLIPSYKNLGLIFERDYIDYDSAMLCFNKAAAHSRECGRNDLLSEVLCEMGNVSQAQGQYSLAKAKFTEALSLAHETNSVQGQIASLYGLASAYFALNDYAKSAACASQCVELENKYGYNLYSQQANAFLVKDYARLGRYDEMDALFGNLQEYYWGLSNKTNVLDDSLFVLENNYNELLEVHDAQVEQLQSRQRELASYRLAFYGLLGLVLSVLVVVLLKKQIRR